VIATSPLPWAALLPPVALLPLVVLTGHTLVNALLLRRVPAGQSVTERVAVLLPLRDEADRVTPCLESLLAQRGVPDLEIIVLDDGSTDGTADVVRSVAGDKVRLLHGTPPPPGWLGKPAACARLAEAAGDGGGAEVLVFVDADVVLEPDAVAGAVALLRKSGADLLSPYPRIVGAGRLMQPLLQWSWLTFLPLRIMESSPRPSLAAAGGQWLVADRAGYERAGGHAAVRDDVLEDIGLARAVKRSGGRIALADGSRHATCHMYSSWGELADGYAKSLWASFGSAPGATVVVALLLLLYTVPPLAALLLGVYAGTTAAGWTDAAMWADFADGTGAAGVAGWAGAALVAYALGVVGRMISAAATGGRTWPDPLAQPVSIAAFAVLVARSFARRRRGLLTWKGRTL
jgi:hypothetical protein